MTTLDDLLRQHDRLTIIHVERWVARGLLRPAGDAEAWAFEAVDEARVRLLAELAADLGVDDDDTLEMVVDLVDQVHTLRGQLDLLGRAIADQPARTREAIATELTRLGER